MLPPVGLRFREGQWPLARRLYSLVFARRAQSVRKSISVANFVALKAPRRSGSPLGESSVVRRESKDRSKRHGPPPGLRRKDALRCGCSSHSESAPLSLSPESII